MKDIISKELLSQVLQLYNEPFDLLIDGSYLKFSHYVDYISNNPIEPYQFSKSDDNINIYELAHKCKEWANSKGFSAISWYPDFEECKGKKAICNLYEPFTDFKDYSFSAISKTEPEAIFKSCQWILDNKDRQ